MPVAAGTRRRRRRSAKACSRRVSHEAWPHDSGALDFIAEAGKADAESRATPTPLLEVPDARLPMRVSAAVSAGKSPHAADGDALACPPRMARFTICRLPASAQDDGWGSEWGGFGAEVAHHTDSEEAAIGAAEARKGSDDELGHVDFAAITGTAAPDMAATGDAVVPAEPPKKKKRRREANPFVRFVGVVVAGLLSLPCVWAIAGMTGTKMDFLPSWAQWPWPKKQAANPPRIPPSTPPVQPSAADANTTPANPTPPSADSGNANNNSSIANAAAAELVGYGTCCAGCRQSARGRIGLGKRTSQSQPAKPDGVPVPPSA